MLFKLQDYFKPVRALAWEYKGTVINNADPEQIGRIQVNIPGFLEGTIDNLPWIYQKSPAMLGGNGVSSSFAVPEIGSEILVEFPYRDIYSGFYSAYWQSSNTHQGFLNEDYPNSYGFSDASGNQFKIDKTKQFLEFLHSSGAYFFIDNESNITLRTNSQIIFSSSDQQNQIIFDLTTGTISNSANATLSTDAIVVNNTVQTQNDVIGTHNDTVQGGRITNILGGENKSVGGDIAHSALGNYLYTAAGNKSTLIAGTTTETFGLSKSETVVLGNWEVTLEAGNISLSTTVGSTEIGNEIGSFSVGSTGEITAENEVGSLTIGATGSISLENSIGSIAVDPTGDITIENDASTLTMSAEGDIKIKNAASGELHITPTGQVALGSELAELLDLLGQVIDTFIENAALIVYTGVGPGTLNPDVVATLTTVQGLLTSITGTL